MKKVEITLEQMRQAVQQNSKAPWTIVNISRPSWFRKLVSYKVTMAQLQSIDTIDTKTETLANKMETSINKTETDVLLCIIRYLIKMVNMSSLIKMMAEE